ncbi:MAG: hypothetical protein ACMXYG_04210 [Candidatus Woesearchaeota archaeon]
MIDEAFIMNVTAVIAVLVFTMTLMLPKIWKYFANGLILLALGVIPFLHGLGLVNFNTYTIPIFQYLVLIIAIFAGRELIIEGFKGEEGAVGLVSIFAGIILIVITTVPALYNFGAITFTLPAIPDEIIYGFYAFAGLMLALGAFTLKDDKI